MTQRAQIITRNAIRCVHCGDVIESTYRHEFKWCSCKTVAVDGGHDYLRRCFKTSPADFEELSEWEDVSPEELPDELDES